MNLETIISNFNRGRMYLNEIQWLIDTVEQLEEENGAMAEKHAEKDLAIREFMEISAQQMEKIAQLEAIKDMYLNANLALLEQNDRLMKQAKEMKQNSRLTRFFEMAEENLRLAEETDRLDKAIKIAMGNTFDDDTHEFLNRVLQGKENDAPDYRWKMGVQP